MKTNLFLTLAAAGLLACAGCASFKTKQLDTYDTRTQGTNQIAGQPGIQTRSTEVHAWTLFSAKSSLASFAARQADASQSATVGSLTQQGGTNAAGTLEAVAKLLLALPR